MGASGLAASVGDSSGSGAELHAEMNSASALKTRNFICNDPNEVDQRHAGRRSSPSDSELRQVRADQALGRGAPTIAHDQTRAIGAKPSQLSLGGRWCGRSTALEADQPARCRRPANHRRQENRLAARSELHGRRCCNSFLQPCVSKFPRCKVRSSPRRCPSERGPHKTQHPQRRRAGGPRVSPWRELAGDHEGRHRHHAQKQSQPTSQSLRRQAPTLAAAA